MLDELRLRIGEVIYSYKRLLMIKYPTCGFLLALIGIFVLVRAIGSFVTVLSDTMVPRPPRLGKYQPVTKRGHQNWAVVTGSTAGIGLEYARQLAASKFNVALVSRSPAKLSEHATEIAEKYGVETAVHALDAVTAQNTQYLSLKSFVEQLGPVSVLINNLGVSHEMPVPFTEVSSGEMHSIVQVNVVSTLEITKAVLPSLQKYTAENKGARALILTMGSFAGLTPTPLLSVYSGSKLFLQGWSSAIAQELRPENIDVQLVLSYLVTSQMSKIRRTSLMIPDPRHFVKSTLRQIGLNGGAVERAYTLTPYWSHAIMHWGIDNLLGVYSSLVASINYRMHVGIRQRALRKKAKTQ